MRSPKEGSPVGECDLDLELIARAEVRSLRGIGEEAGSIPYGR